MSAAVLRELCDSDEPLLAGVANVRRQLRLGERSNDLDRALAAARRMLAAFEDRRQPVAARPSRHSRIGELCLQVEPGRGGATPPATRRCRSLERARRLVRARPGAAVGIVLANLQRGALDEAEQWLRAGRAGRQPTRHGQAAGSISASAPRSCSPAATSRPACGCGAGPSTGSATPASTRRRRFRDRGRWRSRPVAVVAHARHGRLDLVAEHRRRAAGHSLSTHCCPIRRRTDRSSRSAARCCSPSPWRTSIAGAGDRPSGRARMIALAERFRFAARLPADDVRRARPAASPSGPTGRRTPTRCRRTPTWIGDGLRGALAALHGAWSAHRLRVAVEQRSRPEVADQRERRRTRRRRATPLLPIGVPSSRPAQRLDDRA